MPRGKGKEKQPPPETQFDNALATDENSWAAFGILDERGPPITGEYLIHWQGIDPETGKPYEHTWEAKRGVTQDLIDEWKAKKAQDPLLVGREGQKLKDRQKAARRTQTADKQKRRSSKSSKSDSKSSSAAAKAADPSKKRKRDTASVGGSESGSRRAKSPPQRELRDSSPSVSEIDSSPVAGPSKQPTKPGEKHAHFSLEAVSHGIDRQAADQRPGSTPASRATAAEASTPSKQSGSSANPAARSTPTISLKKPPSASDSQAASARADPFVVLPQAPTKVKDIRASRTTGPKSAKPATARESGPLHMPVKFKSYVPGGAGREADAAAATKAAPSSALGGASQNDPIISFSSPTSSDARGPAGKRRDDREGIDDVNSSASQGQGAGNRINHTQSAAPTAESSGEVIENESGVRLQERFINGKTIMVAITESMSTAGSIPVPETQEARPPLQPDYFVDDLLSVAHEMMAGHPGAVESATGADAEATMPVLPLEQVSEEMQGMVDEESSIVDTSTDHSGSLNPDQTAADSRDQSGSPMAVENQTPVSARPGSTSEPIVRGLKKKVIESPPQMTVDPRAFQQASSAAASPTLSPHQVPAPAEADSSDVVQNVRQLRQSNEDLLEKCQSLTSDNEFLRKQYTLASDRAMEEVQRTEALEATIAQLRQQLKYGLKQRELHVDAIKSQRSAENTRLRAQMHILLQQSRLTDDAVRKKAARFSEMALRNAQLEKQQAQHAEQLQALEERNEELLEQIEMLRANQLGVLDDSDDEGEVDGDDDSTADSDLETEAPHGRRKANGSPEKRDADGDAVMRDGSPAQARRPVQSAPAAAPTPSSVEVKSSQPVPARTAPPQPVTSFLTDGEGVQLDRPVFGCRNHVAGEACKAVFATKAALEEHVHAVIDGKTIR